MLSINNNNVYPIQYNNNNKSYSTSFRGGIPKPVDTFVLSGIKPKESVLGRLIGKIFSPKKPTMPKFAERLHSMITEVTSKSSEATGKDAVVFSIPESPEMVLRVEKSALPKVGGMSKDLQLVPIKYDKSVSENKNLGLPLYLVAERGSKVGKKSSISPLEALSQPDKIMVLQKVNGKHPSQEYFNNLMELMGVDDYHPDSNQLNNFFFLGYIRKNFGNESAIKFLDKCKNGDGKIQAHELAEGSDAFEIVGGQKFYGSYHKFAKSYVKSLKDISELPQEAYDKAVDTIIRPKNFIMDFQHTNNTFVDMENKEFNFMDFVFDKSLYPKYHYDNPVKEFRNVLMGKCFSSKFKSPRSLMIYPEDIAEVKRYSNAINDKVNIASPERFRSDAPFK